jgi:nicotinamidase/pyrazinamidase
MHPIVFVDVDTQFDFMDPAGALYVPGAETLVPNLERLMAYAQERGIPVLASVDAHHGDDPEFEIFPPHCVAGTAGQAKITATLHPAAVTLPNQLVATDDILAQHAVVLEKTVFDMFGNPNADRVLAAWQAQHYVVFGVATDYCVKAAALGLRQRQYPVSLVIDAIKPVTPEGEAAALAELEAAGVSFVTTAEILGG